MLVDAGLKIEHTEEIVKDMEFDPWADRQSVSEEGKAKLRKSLNEAPEPVKAFLMPHAQGDKLLFALHEAIIVGRKG
jgi:hypothetical protein